ncbi:MAG: S-layer family protein, partial [Planctomycetes bacterium]|nr:S-layer family protein [Planctomycetota bacterium]
LDGGNNLAVTAGTGNVLFTGAAGNLTRLGAVTVNSATDVTETAGMRAASFVQAAGTGNTTFNGVVNLDTVTGLQVTTNNINVNAAVTTVNNGVVTLVSAANIVTGAAGSVSSTGNVTMTSAGTTTIGASILTANGATVTFNNTGLLTLAAAGDIFADGAVTQNIGLVSTAGDITTTDDNVTFAGAVTLTGNVAMSSGAGVGNLTFNATVNATGVGVEALTLNSGAGNISFNAAVGGVTQLGVLTINSANNVTGAAAITASSISQVEGIGTTTFNGAVTTTAAAGIDLNTENVTVNNTITTQGGGTVTITNVGTLTIAAAGDMNLDGAFLQDGTGLVLTAGDITTTNDNVSFSGPSVLTGNVALNTGAGVGNVTFLNILDALAAGTQTLTVTAGTGNVVLNAAAGRLTRLGTVTINSATNVTAEAITATNITQVAGTGVTTLNGAVNTSAAAGVAITTATVNLNNTLTTTGGGTVTFTDGAALNIAAAGDIFADGAVLQQGGGAVTTAGDITTTNDNVTFTNGVTLSGNVLMNTGAGAGDITYNATINATTAGRETLSLAAGTGNITFTGAAGAVTRLGAVVINTAANVTETAGLTAASLVQEAGTGTTLFTGAVNTNAPAGVSLNTVTITVNNTVTATNLGGVTMTHTGALTIAAAGDIVADGAFLEQGGGAVATAGDITTTNDNITFGDAVTLTGNIALSSGAGEGDITLLNTLNAAAAGVQNLTVTAGVGNVNLIGAVGGVTRLGIMTINSAESVTAAAITAASINQVAGTGTTTLTGAVNTNTAAGVTLTTSDITVNNTITTTANGVVTLTNAGVLTLAAAGDIVADGAVTQNGAGDVFTAGDVTTTNDNISFATSLTLTGSVQMNTGAGAGNVTYTSTLDATDGTEALLVQAGTGNVTFGNTVGAGVALGSLTTFAANAVVDRDVIANGDINMSGIAGDIQLTGEINNSQRIASGTTINLRAGGGALVSDVDAGTDRVTLEIAGGAGTIILGNVGRNGQFLDVRFGDETSDDVVRTQGMMTFDRTNAVASFDARTPAQVILDGNTTLLTTQGGGTGAGDVLFTTTPINGAAAGLQALDINVGSGTVDLSHVGTNEFIGNSNIVQTTGVALGQLTINSGLVRVSQNVITDNVAGGNGGTIRVQSTQGVQLLADLTISSDSNGNNTGGAIDMPQSPINGAQNLVVTAGNGNVNLGNIGQGTRLTSLTVDSDGVTTLGASDVNISTVNDVDFSRAVHVRLAGNLDADSTNGDILFTGGNVDGAFAVDFTSGGSADLSNFGQTTALTRLNIQSQTTQLLGNGTTTGSITVTSVRDISIAGDVLTQNGDITLSVTNVADGRFNLGSTGSLMAVNGRINARIPSTSTLTQGDLQTGDPGFVFLTFLGADSFAFDREQRIIELIPFLFFEPFGSQPIIYWQFAEKNMQWKEGLLLGPMIHAEESAVSFDYEADEEEAKPEGEGEGN